MPPKQKFNSNQIARLRWLNLLFMLIIFVMLGFAFQWHRSHKQLSLVSLDRHFKGELANIRSLIDSQLAEQEQRMTNMTNMYSLPTEASSVSDQDKNKSYAYIIDKYQINSKTRYLAEAHQTDHAKILQTIKAATEEFQDSEKVSENLLNQLRATFYSDLHYRHFAGHQLKDWRLLPIRFSSFYSRTFTLKQTNDFSKAKMDLKSNDPYAKLKAMSTFRDIAVSSVFTQAHLRFKIEALIKCLKFEKTHPPQTRKVTADDLIEIEGLALAERTQSIKPYRMLKPRRILAYLVHLFHSNLSINPSPGAIAVYEGQILMIAPEYASIKNELEARLKLIEKVRKQIDGRELPTRLYLGEDRFFYASKYNMGLLFKVDLPQFLAHQKKLIIDDRFEIKFVEQPPLALEVQAPLASEVQPPLAKNAEQDQSAMVIRSANDNPYIAKLSTYDGLSIMIPFEIINTATAAIDQRFQMVNGIILSLAIMNLCCFLVLMRLLNREHELHGLRTRFLSTVSHELKTPLSLIRLYTESLLLGRVKDDKRQAYLDTILIETDRLSGIVSNIVDFSTVERDQLELNLTDVSLTETCMGTLEGFRKRFETEQFDVQSEISDNITLMTDRLVFTQILFNLIDNAMKYSGGKKVIKIMLKKVTDQVVLRVSDQGIGIPDKEKLNIFTDFYRVDDENVRARRGSGIGLFLVKQFVNQMNGTVSVMDNQPTGSIFEIRLPVTS